MLVIPMWQPHASAVALGLKKIETRGFAIKYRGPVAIHAAKKWDGEIKGIIGDLPPFVHKAFADADCLLAKMDLPLGKIIAVAELIDCLRTNWEHPRDVGIVPLLFGQHGLYTAMDTPLERALGNYEPGRFGWVLSNVRALPEPISYKAHQGCYVLDAATAQRVRGEVS